MKELKIAMIITVGMGLIIMSMLYISSNKDYANFKTIEKECLSKGGVIVSQYWNNVPVCVPKL
jgi:hypothetical protein